MIGAELARNTAYLLERADAELNVPSRLGKLATRLAPIYVSLFGVPEIGVQVRILHALRHIPRGTRGLLDAGCGAGMLLGAVHRKSPQTKLTGIELQSESASLAARTHPYATILAADLVNAKSEDHDVCVCIDVLEHIADESLAGFMAALHRSLVPGGTLVLHVPAAAQRRFFRRFDAWEHHDHEREGFTDSALRALVRDAGFSDIVIRATFGSLAAFAWELNMIVSATPLQAPLFPLLLGLAWLGEQLPTRRGNGLLLLAKRGSTP